jgi:hypothetical protein
VSVSICGGLIFGGLIFGGLIFGGGLYSGGAYSRRFTVFLLGTNENELHGGGILHLDHSR